MSSGPLKDPPPRDDDRELAEDALPPVEPPTAGFLLQLFFIPLLIVAIVVLVFFSVSWLSQSETDLEQVVKELERGGPSTWTKAKNLADLLQEPRYDQAKSDRELAGRLAKVLENSIASNTQDDESLNLRTYLARACGEFRVLEPVEVLIQAATTDRSEKEAQVRVSGLEGLAILAGNNPDANLAENPKILEAIEKGLAEKAELGDAKDMHGKLRERAAFLLGVLGGEKQNARLVELLQDPFVNVRYNAALGLARHGDERAIPILLDMLDPENPEVVQGEKEDSGKQWKRQSVAFNALRAVAKLVKDKPNADYSAVAKALVRLKESNIGGQLRAAANDVLLGLPKMTTP